MRQGLQFPLFGVMLLAIGLAAGKMIPGKDCCRDDPQLSVGNAPPVAQTAASSDQATADLTTAPQPDFQPDFQPERVDMPFADVNHPTPPGSPIRLAAASSADDRSVIHQLICRTFPDADAATVEVWAETFEGMPPGEVRDVLEQKKLLSGSLDSIFTPGLQSSRAPAIAQSGEDGRELQREVARKNLQHAWTVGYRRRLVLPGAALHGSVQPAFNGHNFVDFSSGRCVKSPFALHVALQKSALYMFMLDDGTLTRRGDFRILPGGQIGLSTPTGPRALKNSPVVSDVQQRLRLFEHGELQSEVVSAAAADAPASGNSEGWTTIGRVGAVEVLRADLLMTDDGVHFQAASPAAWRELPSAEICLLPGTLELSNVDPAEELQRLESLDR